MGVRVLFSSDLHGNDEHLERLLRYAEHVEAVDVVVLGGDLGPRGTGFGRDADGMRDLLSHPPKRGDGKIDWTTDEALAYMREGYASQKKWFTRTLVPMLERCAVPSVCLFGNSDWAGPFRSRERRGRKHPGRATTRTCVSRTGRTCSRCARARATR